MPRNAVLATIAAAFAILTPLAASAADLPAGFVHLKDVDPSIRQDMRYAGPDNFMGRPAAGYHAADCILAKQAANALAEVQATVAKYGLTIAVLDCYRPVSAVEDFVRWAKEGGGYDPRWNPRVKRDELIAQGYIASKSAHSRGSTVDLTLAPLTGPVAADADCGATNMRALDFGTGFDCFDPKSHTNASGLSTAPGINRKKLVEWMEAAGFVNYKSEWWHFTLKREPFKQRFDFPVESGS